MLSSTDEDPIIRRVKRSTRELEKLNKEIRLMLNKLPLRNYREIARIHKLVNEQLRYMSITTGGAVPTRFMLPFDNARDTAIFLRSKYSDAVMKGKIRRQEDEQKWNP